MRWLRKWRRYLKTKSGLPVPKQRKLPVPADKELEWLRTIYDTISKNIERENTLINFRIMWAIVLSGGILAAEGVIINYVQEYHPREWWLALVAHAGVLILSCLAVFFCFRSWIGVAAAQRQMEYVKRRYYLHRTRFDELGFPRPFGDKKNHRRGNYAAITFPIALASLWCIFTIPQIVRGVWLLVDRAGFESQIPKEVKAATPIIDALSIISDKLGPYTPIPKR